MKPSVFLVLIMLSYMIRPSQAQTTSPSLQGEIRGKVLDSKTKAPLDYVSVTILNAVGKVVSQVLTNDDGCYIVKRLDPGDYSITVRNIGYISTKVTDIEVEADVISFVNVPMENLNEPKAEVVITRTCCFCGMRSENKRTDQSEWLKAQANYRAEKDLSFNCVLPHKSRLIEQNLKESAVKLFNEVKSFPTSPHSLINIESMYDGEKEIFIRNLNGQEVYHGTIVHHLQLDVSAYAKGLYVAIIVDKVNDEKNSTKFIVTE